MGNTELFAELLKVSQITLCLVNQTLCSSGNLLFYCNSKALYKHLANRFNLSSCQKHVQSKKITLLEATIFDYFKYVNDRWC